MNGVVSDLQNKTENVHQESKRHQCDVCELSFKAKTSLYFHKMTLHKTMTIKPEVKEESSKIFNSTEKAKKHQNNKPKSYCN